MKIALVLPDFAGGGAERVVLSMAREFLGAGHEVEFVVMRPEGELIAEAKALCPIISLDIDRRRDVPWALSRYLKRHRPDAVIAGIWPLTVGSAVGRLLSGHRCRLMLVEHSTLSTQYGWQNRLQRAAMRISMGLAYRAADVVVGVSQGVVDDISTLSMRRRDAFQTVYNPIDPRPAPDEAALRAADELWGVPAGGRIIAVGRFKPQKNYPLLLHAFARLVQSRDATLMILGNGDDEASLRALADELGIAEKIIFAGFHKDPTPFYRTADLFVLSSDYEGFGNVIVEAMACGTPIVSTDCRSGPAEILEHGKYGMLVPVGDEAALASAMAESLTNTHDKDLLCARARDFSPEKAAARYLNLLQ